MKRTLIIIAGIVLILALVGVWVYVLLNGSPENTPDQFADLEFGDTTDTDFTPFVPESDNDQTIVNVGGTEALRQLTTKPVIGYTEAQTTGSTSAAVVYYVEAGTGHIFTINLETGEEVRVSATTIPLARRAAITPDGQHVLVQAGEGSGATFVVGTINESTGQLTNREIREPITSFAATDANQFVYAVPAANGLTARSYDPITASTAALFAVPFREAAIIWNQAIIGPHIIHPTANSRLEGMVYTATNGVIKRTPLSGYGLSAIGSAVAIIASQTTSDNGYITVGHSIGSTVVRNVPISVIPEKCAFSPIAPERAICGTSLDGFSTHTPTDWYRGVFSPSDGLWVVTPNIGAASLLVASDNATGKKLDIQTPVFSLNGQRYYFNNKLDNTLWVYDFTK